MLMTVIILASACSTIIPVPIALQNPPELTLPKLDPDQLQCLTNEAYTTLVKRDKLQTERRMTLRSIINTTKGK